MGSSNTSEPSSTSRVVPNNIRMLACMRGKVRIKVRSNSPLGSNRMSGGCLPSNAQASSRAQCIKNTVPSTALHQNTV